MSRPARENPTRNFRCNIEVEPSPLRTTSSIASSRRSSLSSGSPPPARPPPSRSVALDGVDVVQLLGLAAPVGDDLVDVALLDPGALDPVRPGSTRRSGAACRPCRSASRRRAVSRMTRESARLETEKASRDGHVGLDDAGDHVDRRALGGDHEVDADGPGHLGDAADTGLDVAGGHHHEVGELVHHHHDERAAARTPVRLPGDHAGDRRGRRRRCSR